MPPESPSSSFRRKKVIETSTEQHNEIEVEKRFSKRRERTESVRQEERIDRQRDRNAASQLLSQINATNEGTTKSGAKSKESEQKILQGMDRRQQANMPHVANDIAAYETRQSAGNLIAALFAIGHIAGSLFQFLKKGHWGSETTATKNKPIERPSVRSEDIDRVILVLRQTESSGSVQTAVIPLGHSLDRIEEASRHMTDEQREELKNFINNRLASAGLPWHARNLYGEVGFYRPIEGN
jgi:hypothetical protein